MSYIRLVRKPFIQSDFFLLLVLVFASLLAWIPCIDNRFLLNRDDLEQIFNFDVDHLSIENIRIIFSSLYVSMYQPISSMCYALINTFWYHNARAFHIFSILVHLANVVLVWRLMAEFSLSTVWRWVIVAVFAIHPMQQEAIAWVSATSTLLYSAFYISSLIFYITYLKTSRFVFYVLAFLCFVLGCMCKVNATTLTVVLVGIDYVFNKRLLSKGSLLNKLPFLLVSITFGLVATLERTGMVTVSSTSLYSFIKIVPYQLAMPAVEFFLPTKLLSFYELPYRLPVQEVVVSSIVLVALVVTLILRPKNKIVVLGLLIYFSNLALVTGVFGFSFYLTAMRYSYIAIIGLLLCSSQLFPIPKNKVLYLTPIFVFLWLLSFSSANRWKDDFAIRKSDLKISPNATKSTLELANLYYEQAKVQDSALYYIDRMKSERDISPYDYIKKEQLKGAVLLAKQDYIGARDVLEALNKKYPNNLHTLVFLAQAYCQTNQSDLAIKIIIKDCFPIFDGKSEELFYQMSTTLYNVYIVKKEYGSALNTIDFLTDGIKKRYRNSLIKLHDIYVKKALLLDTMGDAYINDVLEALINAKECVLYYNRDTATAEKYQENIDKIRRSLGR